LVDANIDTAINSRPGGWKVLRRRTDKPANALKTIISINQSIKEQVEKEDLIDILNDISREDFEQSVNGSENGGNRNKRLRSQSEMSDHYDEDDF